MDLIRFSINTVDACNFFNLLSVWFSKVNVETVVLYLNLIFFSPTRKWQPCRLRALLDNLYHLYDSNKTTTAKDNSGCDTWTVDYTSSVRPVTVDSCVDCCVSHTVPNYRTQSCSLHLIDYKVQINILLRRKN